MPSNVLPSPGAGVTQPPPLPGSAPSRGADPRAVDEMVARIAERESLDAAARARMAEDLRQTDPALWPLLTHYFQAALAYRRQADERQAARGGNEVSSAPAGSSAATQSLPLRAELPELAAGERQARAPQKDGPFERAAAQAPTAPLPDPSPHAQPPRESPSERDAGSTQATAKPDAQAQAFSGPAPARTKDTHDAEKAPLKAAPAKAEGEGVVAASYETPSGANARTVEDRLAALIKSLESEARQSPQSSADVAWHARLRLLYLAANRREDALRPIPSVSPAEQEFLSQTVYGISTWLDPQRTSDPGRRAAETKHHLTSAVSRLGELAPLVVRNLAFTPDVRGYGDIKAFPKNEFSPGQEVILYVEVENFKSEETPKGFHSAFRGSYEIFDARNQRVSATDLGTTEEHCRNQRRDFFLNYRFSLPKRIYAGRHTLQLTIEDLKAQKIGQSSIEFTIKATAE